MADAPPYGIARTRVLAMLGKSPMMLNAMPNTCPASSVTAERAASRTLADLEPSELALELLLVSEGREQLIVRVLLFRRHSWILGVGAVHWERRAVVRRRSE
jgi:hypothetical protein